MGKYRRRRRVKNRCAVLFSLCDSRHNSATGNGMVTVNGELGSHGLFVLFFLISGGDSLCKYDTRWEWGSRGETLEELIFVCFFPLRCIIDSDGETWRHQPIPRGCGGVYMGVWSATRVCMRLRGESCFWTSFRASGSERRLLGEDDGRR